MSWYDIDPLDGIDSPSLVLYEDRLDHNLSTMLGMVNGASSRLMPHVKTNKMPEVIKRMMALGISNFKASTIAEADMAAAAGARHVLIAHQLVGPKIDRFMSLIKQYPNTDFSTIIDNIGSLNLLYKAAVQRQSAANVFVDINNGMNRSGIELGSDLNELIVNILKNKSLIFRGLHIYDGHHRDVDFATRNEHIEEGFKGITELFNKLRKRHPEIKLICGGTPSFSSHHSEKERICSPGTCLFWDWGYAAKLKEQAFKPAVLLVTRVISKPNRGRITIDMGHKAVASENPIDRRVKFLNLEDYELISQSEEHGVLKVGNWEDIHVGDVFFGLPYHICPTVNLYDEVSVIKEGRKIASWEISARKRKIHI
jgi:D-serine deaminase-like pyridoxal phosphate-dependent protein